MPSRAVVGGEARAWLIAFGAACMLVVVALSSSHPGRPLTGGVRTSAGGSPDVAGAGPTVIIKNQDFGTAELATTVGIGVSFVNQESVTHVVAEGTSGDEAANPRIPTTRIPGAEKRVIVFPQAGDYHLTCLIHQRMEMVVHVR